MVRPIAFPKKLSPFLSDEGVFSEHTVLPLSRSDGALGQSSCLRLRGPASPHSALAVLLSRHGCLLVCPVFGRRVHLDLFIRWTFHLTIGRGSPWGSALHHKTGLRKGQWDGDRGHSRVAGPGKTSAGY